MNTPKINPELLNLLKSGEFDVFTRPALTSAYFDQPSCKNSSKKGAGKLVARHVNALVSECLVARTSTENTRPISYRLTDKFREIYGYPKPHKVPNEHANINFAVELRDKLRSYKVEMLVVIGEIDEYEELSLYAPEKLPEIQDLYRLARDRFSKTQGRIKALENMLSKLESK